METYTEKRKREYIIALKWCIENPAPKYPPSLDKATYLMQEMHRNNSSGFICECGIDLLKHSKYKEIQ